MAHQYPDSDPPRAVEAPATIALVEAFIKASEDYRVRSTVNRDVDIRFEVALIKARENLRAAIAKATGQ